MDWSVLWVLREVIQTLGTISAFIAILYARKKYNLTKTVQVLRPHSDRLKEEFRKWVEGDFFPPQIVSPLNLPEYDFASSPSGQAPSTTMMKFALQHLESGYPDLYSSLNKLGEEIAKHNRRVNEFAERLHRYLETELRVPDRRGEQYAYYRRTVAYILQKTLIPQQIREEFVLAEDREWDLWRLKLSSGTVLVTGSKETCEKALNLVEELLKDPEVATEAKELYEEAEELKKKREELREALHLRLVDAIEAGGLLKGSCEVCVDVDM